MKSYKGHIKNTCNSDGLIITKVFFVASQRGWVFKLLFRLTANAHFII